MVTDFRTHATSSHRSGSRSAIIGTLAVFVLLFCFATPVYASLTGDLQGTVYDSSGALVSGAQVKIRNVSTGAIRTATTNDAGQFAALQLDLGAYEVTVEKAGFRIAAETVNVRNGDISRITMNLQVGQGEQQIVTVEGGVTPVLDVATAQVSSTFDSKTMVNLPLLGRNPVAFATLSPGIVPVTKDNPFLGTGSFNSNGSRGRANNITIDNNTATDISTTGSSGIGTLSLDGIQEVKVITNNFNAEFGRNSGAQVQIVTKQGTNDYHGSVYWFHQNAAFNARDYFDATGSPTPFKQNQWGFALGGPVVKNHLFAFGHYEGIHTRGAGSSAVANVLTPTQAAAITDPTSKAVFAQLLAPTSASGSVSNSAPNAGNTVSWSLRVDEQFGSNGRDNVSFRYGTNPNTNVSPGLTFIGTNLPNYGAQVASEARTFNAGWTHVLSPTLINQARFAFGRSNPNFTPNTTLAQPYGVAVTIPSFDGFGLSNILPQGRTQNTFQYSDSVSKALGRHSLKFGGDVLHYQANSIFDANFRGTVTFSNLAAFQTGVPNGFSERFGTSVRHNFSTDAFVFAQDDFRITQALTLNLGLRLESAGGVSERNGLLSNLNVNSTTPLGGGGTGPLGSIDLGGSSFQRNYNWAPRLGFALNPGQGKLVVRGGFGMAYDYIFLNPITNLRFSAPFIPSISLTPAQITGTNSYANLVAGTGQAQTDAKAAVGQFLATQVNFGTLSPVQQNLQNPRNMQWDFGVEYQFLKDLTVKASYVASKNDRLQVSLPVNLVVTGVVPVPSASEADEIARLNQFSNVFNAESGNASGSAVNNRLDHRFNSVTEVESIGHSNFNSFQLDVIKQFSHGFSFGTNYTYSHSIDDISDALGVLVNDSASLQDPRSPFAGRANSQFDIRHRSITNFVYEIPYARHFSGVAGKVLDGWGLSGIFEAHTGFPATIFSGTRRGISDILLDGNSVVRANGNASSFTPVPSGSAASLLIPIPCDRGVNTSGKPPSPLNPGTLCTNTSGFPLTQALLGNAGTSGRNSLTLANLVNLDAGIFKNTKVTERVGVQFRWETYNLLNHPNFSGFVNNLTSTAFGTYQRTATDSRRMQGSIKILF